MKAEGIEYEERMELLEDVTYPKPLQELLEAAYETYRRGHPWVADYELEPKSVVRDMYERAMTFTEYVSFYGLSRSEGLVLRYLADAYRALRQTVPEDARTEELTDLIEWLGELVRQVDSSLLDEWERLRNPGASRSRRPGSTTSRPRSPATPAPSGCWSATPCSAGSSWPPCAGTRSWASWTARPAGPASAGAGSLDDYFAEYDEIGTGPAARGPALLHIEAGPAVWKVRQVFDDPEGDHDWGIDATVDLAESDELGAAAVTVTNVGPH